MPSLPSLSQLTAFALSVLDALPGAADWQRPAMTHALNDLSEVLRDHYRAADPGDDDEPTYNGDGVACEDDDGTAFDGDMMAMTAEIASDPDGWADKYEDMLDGAAIMDARADRMGW